MKKVEMYQCEICNRIYHTAEEAISCESKGKELPLVNIGDVVKYKVENDGGFPPFYEGLIVKSIKDQGHYLEYDFTEHDGKYHDNWYLTYGNEEFKRLCTIIE